MPQMILPAEHFKRFLRQRRLRGEDRFDEVWNGVYVLSPLANNDHQWLATRLASRFDQALGATDAIKVFAGTNVSDQPTRWKKNYRCPDVAVFFPGNPAEDRGTHWFGGPDFVVEILSPGDRSRKKFAFYAKIGVRELLLIDRDPWRLELYRLRDGALEPVGMSDVERPLELSSTVLPLNFRLLPGQPRPRIEMTRSGDGAVCWA